LRPHSLGFRRIGVGTILSMVLGGDREIKTKKAAAE